MTAIDLKGIFEEAGIKRIVIIDDAFDEYPQVPLTNEQVDTFLAAIDEDMFGILLRLLDISEAAEDTEGIVVNRLCMEVAAVEQVYRNRETWGHHADILFGGFDRDQRSKRAQLENLVILLNSACSDVCPIGACGEADSILPVQMLFVDLKLDSGSTLTTDPAIQIIKRYGYDQTGEDIIIVLMSSLTSQLHNYREQIRSACALFRTQFEVLEKPSAHPQLSWLLADLAKTRMFIRAMRKHREGWKTALEQAASALDTVFMDLDVPDYFMLRDVVVKNEGITLGKYISELMREYVSHQMARSSEIKQFESDLDSWSLERSPRTHFRRHRSVELLYQHSMLIPDHGDLDIRLGDIYERIDPKNGALKVVVVTTPECDLVTGGKRMPVDRILTCEGVIAPLTANEWISRTRATTPLLLEVRSVSYVIDWDLKKPLTLSRSKLERGNDCADRKWHYLGRLRPVFALEVQQALTGSLSRVGVPVRPVVFTRHKVVVFVREADKWAVLDHGPAYGGYLTNKSTKESSFMIQDTELRMLLETVVQWCKREANTDGGRLHELLQGYDVYSRLKYAVNLKRELIDNKDKTQRWVPLLASTQRILAQKLVFADEKSYFNAGRPVHAQDLALIVFKFIPTDEHEGNV